MSGGCLRRVSRICCKCAPTGFVEGGPVGFVVPEFLMVDLLSAP